MKNDGKWEAKGTIAIQCTYDDGDSVPMLFDKDDNNHSAYSDAKRNIKFQKLSDNCTILQIAYISDKNQFCCHHSWYVFLASNWQMVLKKI